MRKTHFLPGPFGGYISIVALLNKFGKYNSLIFLGIFGLCFLVWRYLFGFPLDVLYGNYDLYGHLSFVSEILHKGFSTESLLYSNYKIGGTALGPVDTPFYLILFHFLTDSPIEIVNLSIIFTQTTLGYYVFRILKVSLPPQSWMSLSLGVILACFSPSLAWRYFHGHLNLVWGCLVFLSVVSLIITQKEKQFRTFDLFLTFIVFVIGFHSINLIQTGLYSLLVLAFIVAFFSNSLKTYFSNKTVILLTSLTVLASLFSLNHLVNVATFLPDLQRDLSSDLIYSYTTQNFKDFFASFFFSYKSINTGRTEFLMHETNLAFGLLPLLACMFFILLKNYRLLALYLSLFFFGVILSSNIDYLSPALLTVMPALKSFRVPARFFIPFNILTIILTIYSFCHLIRNQTIAKQFWTLLVLGFAIPFFITQSIDTYGLGIFILLLIIYFASLRTRPYLLPILLGLYVSSHLISFSDKKSISSFTAEELHYFSGLFKQANQQGNLFLTHHSTMAFANQIFLHQGSILDYYGVDANIPATKRFAEFFLKSSKSPIGLANTEYIINSNRPYYPIFQKLLNIEGEFSFQNQQITYSPKHVPLPFFSPESILSAADLSEFLDVVDELEPEKVSYIEPIYLKSEAALKCRNLKLLKRDAQSATFTVETNHPCLLVLSTNYSPFLSLTSSAFQEIERALPVNWIMSGFYLRAGNYQFEIRPKSILGHEKWFRLTALILFILLLGIHFIQERKEN